MDINKIKHRALPHFLSIAGFLFITFLMFRPLFVSDKDLQQSDIENHKATSHEVKEFRQESDEEALWTNALFGGMPAYLISTKGDGQLLSYLEKYTFNIFPSYTTCAFLINLVGFYILLLSLGFSSIWAFIGAAAFTLCSNTIISLQTGHNTKIAALGYAPIVLAGVHLTFKKEWLIGLALTAMAVGLEIKSNHLQITYYLLFMLLFYGIYQAILAYKNEMWKSFFNSSGILIIAALLGIATNAGSLWSLVEYSSYSTRGGSELNIENIITNKSSANKKSKKKSDGLNRDYVFQWSNDIPEVLTLIVPNYFGGQSTAKLGEGSETYKNLKDRGVAQSTIDKVTHRLPMYFGDQPFTEGPVYFGAIVVFLFVMAITMLRRETRIWLIGGAIICMIMGMIFGGGASIFVSLLIITYLLGVFYFETNIRTFLIITILFSILLSWGGNFKAFNYFMFEYFPFYDKFRAVTMSLSIAQISVYVLALIALKDFFSLEDKEKQKHYLIWSVGISLGICLLIIVFSGFRDYSSPADSQFQKNPWLLESIKEDRANFVRADAWRSFIFILLGAIPLYMASIGKLSLKYSIIILGVLIISDLGAVSRRYLNSEDFAESENVEFKPTPSDKRILKDTSYYRVFDLRNPFNRSRTSYFHHSVGGYHGAKMQRYQDLIDVHLNKEHKAIINSIRNQNFDENVLKRQKILNMLNTKYIMYSDNANGVIKNPYAFGPAWFVSRLKRVGSPEKEILNLDKITHSQIAVIDTTEFSLDNYVYSGSEETSLRFLNYEPNHLQYEYQSDSPGFIVFSEIYYPHGWTAYIDGESQSHVRVNYLLRGMKVPAGEHKIEFKFQPKSYYVGNQISLVSSIILFCLIIGAVLKSVYRD